VPAARDRAVLAGAVATFAGGAILARRAGVTRTELRWFELVNGLSHRVHAPVWALMQLGSLGGPLVTGAVIRVAGHRGLGTRVMTVGALTWVAAKAVKPSVRRDRPAATIPKTRVLGHEQSGLGYPSGHAAVAAATAAVVAPHLPRRWRPVAWAVALGVGPTRVYVGAHLPLDVLGGVALGVASGTASRWRDSGRATPAR
jgi:glycosyltransferase 2 family protein